MRDFKVFTFWLQLFSDNRLLSSSAITQIELKAKFSQSGTNNSTEYIDLEATV